MSLFFSDERLHIGFTGTRNFNYITPKRLDDLTGKIIELREKNLVTLHHGDSVGMDSYVHGIALRFELEIVIHPPTNLRFRALCREATLWLPAESYLKRNKSIVACSSILIAVPKDPDNEELRSGTWATVRYARKAKKEIILI